MNKRLSQLRKALNLSMEEFGKKIGVGRSTISRLESGTNNFTDQMIRSICREFNVNEVWLRTGEGDMFKKKTKEEEIAEFCGAMFNSDMQFKRDLIATLAKLDEKSWIELEKFAKTFIDVATKKEE